jgi:transposase InsO family protein
MLGFEVAQSTVSKYMVRRGTSPWKTFLGNHAQAIAAIDRCAVPTLNFDLLFAFLVLGHGRRQLLWFEVTRDNDRAYGNGFTSRVRAMGIRDRPISPWSPWQNGYAERLIGTLRRECLDQVLIFSEMHLRRILLRCALASSSPTLWRHCRHSDPGWTAPPIRPDMIFGKNTMAPASPWQNGFAERLIGSIRRECVDHLIVWEKHICAEC